MAEHSHIPSVLHVPYVLRQRTVGGDEGEKKNGVGDSMISYDGRQHLCESQGVSWCPYVVTLCFLLQMKPSTDANLLSASQFMSIHTRVQTYQKKPVAKTTRATTPITMPAIAPVEREACECWSSSSSSADSDTTRSPADEVVEPRVPEDCEAAVAAMLVSVRALCADEEASCGVLSPGSKTYFDF